MVDVGRVREGMDELLHHSDYIVASEEFAVEFGGTPGRGIEET